MVRYPNGSRSENPVVVGSRAVNFGCADEGAPRYPNDPAKAKQLLSDAGFPNGFDIDLYAYRDRPHTEARIGYLRAVGTE